MVIMSVKSMEWWLLNSVHGLIYRCANISGNWGSCHANLHVGKIEPCHHKIPCLALPLTVVDHDRLWVIWLNWGDTFHVHVTCSLPMWPVSPLDTCSIAFNKMAAETIAGCGNLCWLGKLTSFRSCLNKNLNQTRVINIVRKPFHKLFLDLYAMI